MNPLDLLYDYNAERVEVFDECGVFRRERRSEWSWRRLELRIWIEELFQWWECDFCDRRIWVPLMEGHSFSHSSEEWAAAGYDKEGTMLGSQNARQGQSK